MAKFEIDLNHEELEFIQRVLIRAQLLTKMNLLKTNHSAHFKDLEKIEILIEKFNKKK